MNTPQRESRKRAGYIPAKGVHAQKSLDWLFWADRDYLAARRLLLDNLIVQGASFANTALEKYLKAILAVEGKSVPRVHDPLSLYRKTKPGGTLQLDEKFLTLLAKAYELRYPDDLEAGYNIVLSQALILIALDEAIFEITKRFEFGRTDGRPVQRLLDFLVESRDPRIIHMNVALNVVKKDVALNTQSRVYEMRVLPNGTRMEIEYSTAKIENTGIDRDAFVQINEKQFHLAFTPIPEPAEQGTRGEIDHPHQQ